MYTMLKIGRASLYRLSVMGNNVTNYQNDIMIIHFVNWHCMTGVWKTSFYTGLLCQYDIARFSKKK